MRNAVFSTVFIFLMAQETIQASPVMTFEPKDVPEIVVTCKCNDAQRTSSDPIEAKREPELKDQQGEK